MRAAPPDGACVQVEVDAILVEAGGVIDAERLRLGLTVTTLARRAGLSKQAVVDSRLARRDARLSTLVRQAHALRLRVVVRVEPDTR